MSWTMVLYPARAWSVEFRKLRMRRVEFGRGETEPVRLLPIERQVAVIRRRREGRETWAEMLARAA